MLIDDVFITVTAGRGGGGSVHFRREKYLPRGGPDGGNGGKGGDVIFLGDRDITLLRQFQNKKELVAGHGVDGAGQKRHGAKGADLTVKIPQGTLVTDKASGKRFEVETGKRYVMARGGQSGRGNWEFRSSTNQAPRHAEPGMPGEHKQVHLSLQLIADIGLVGLPNAGKSSLLNELTNTQVKTANYPFTTLEPNLGDMRGIIIADIPGLIENAHRGRGLGFKFLKHVAKTRLLAYCVSVEADDPVNAYQTVRQEIGQYDEELMEKASVVLLTKTDMVDSNAVEMKLHALAGVCPNVYPVSIHHLEQLAAVQKMLTARV